VVAAAVVGASGPCRRAVTATSSKAMWRSTAAVMATWSCSQSAVLPSMSVKRKVTVPESRSGMSWIHVGGGSWCLSIVACGYLEQATDSLVHHPTDPIWRCT
jgi:hypothetical protein